MYCNAAATVALMLPLQSKLALTDLQNCLLTAAHSWPGSEQLIVSGPTACRASHSVVPAGCAHTQRLGAYRRAVTQHAMPHSYIYLTRATTAATVASLASPGMALTGCSNSKLRVQ